MVTPFSTPATAEEEAYRFLLDGIRLGQFKAGDRLVPDEIASQLGMSRMPVREAFRRLATQELLTIRPNRGAVVRGLSHDEAIEVFEMRSVLEAQAATVAINRIGPSDIDDLERRLGIKVPGRFVGKDDQRLIGQRPGDRHPLLLSAGELVRPVPQAVSQADLFQDPDHPFAGFFVRFGI